MNEPFQLNLLRLQAELRTRLRDAHNVHKVLVYGLRVTRELFESRAGAVATLKPGRSHADLLYSIPRNGQWDQALLTDYILGKHPTIPKDTLLAPIRRHARHWGVLALRFPERDFEHRHREALFALTRTLTQIVREVDERRARKVRRKIEWEIADRQEPKDLIYDLLHGLRSLTRYDHSASLLIAREAGGELELVAEQIAWTKAKSRRIGLRFELDEEMRAQLDDGRVRLYERTGANWLLRRGPAPEQLPELLEVEASDGVPPEVSVVCAPIATPQGAFGLLKISARRHGVLGAWEASLVEEFLPLASLAVQFSVRTESLQEKVLQSERKHALANLTRGITHDVNNAVGAMLPLVQQMREDARDGSLEASMLDEDLESLEASLQTCRRIFGGMLAIARGSAQSVGHGNLRRAVDGALSVLGDSLKRRSIEVVLELPRELPTIRGSQGDLTQLFLNLCANARDAMTDGGELRIAAVNGGREVRVTVQDTGCGIPERMLERVSEPFFTTKSEGNGLGLSICRSILWDIGGEIEIDTEHGHGTRVRVSLPVLREDREDGQGGQEGVG
ncbi:MAG: HAMP domain-containing histidine kinase [bacterium]|nr:HAMP domain-containing histidine kinase [bacterium]